MHNTIDLLVERLCAALDTPGKNTLNEMGLAFEDQKTTKRTLYEAIIDRHHEAVVFSHESVDFLPKQKVSGIGKNESKELLEFWSKILIGRITPERELLFFMLILHFLVFRQ